MIIQWRVEGEAWRVRAVIVRRIKPSLRGSAATEAICHDRLLRRASRSYALLAMTALLSVLTPLPSPLHADTSGASFLKLGDGSKPLALGGAYVAMPGDVDSLYYNPGALAFQKSPEASFTHSEWLQSTNLDLISYAHPTAAGTFGVSALRLGGGNFEGRDANRQKTGEFSADDISVLLSYSHKLTDNLGAGANVKYLRSRIADDSASSVAIDLGGLASWPVSQWGGRRFGVGASVLNVGSGLRFVDQVDRLPLTIVGGTSLQLASRLTFAADFAHLPYDSITELRTGAQYSLSLFDFRLGYVQALQGESDKSLSAAEHLRGGIGIRWSRYRADYTLAPFGDLGLTQRFTVAIAFGQSAPEPSEHNLQTPQ